MSSRYTHVTAKAQAIAKRYHNGIAGIAEAMGKGYTVFANKLNPRNAQNQLTVEEAAEITDLSQDPGIADAFAALVGRVTVELPDGEMSLKELSHEFCRLMKECGDVGQQIAMAESPESEWGERISPAERARITTELRQMLSVGVGMLRKVEG